MKYKNGTWWQSAAAKAAVATRRDRHALRE